MNGINSNKEDSDGDFPNHYSDDSDDDQNGPGNDKGAG